MNIVSFSERRFLTLLQDEIREDSIAENALGARLYARPLHAMGLPARLRQRLLLQGDEQLGLRLESTDGALGILVIDDAEKMSRLISTNLPY